MLFADIPDRLNGQNIDFSWFNELKSAGVALEGSQTNIFVLANGVSDQPVTGMAIDKTVLNVVFFKYTIRRQSDIDEGRRTYGELIAFFENKTGIWSLDHAPGGGKGNDSDSGVSFTIDPSTGQVKYSTDAMDPTGYSGKFRSE